MSLKAFTHQPPASCSNSGVMSINAITSPSSDTSEKLHQPYCYQAAGSNYSVTNSDNDNSSFNNNQLPSTSSSSPKIAAFGHKSDLLNRDFNSMNTMVPEFDHIIKKHMRNRSSSNGNSVAVLSSPSPSFSSTTLHDQDSDFNSSCSQQSIASLDTPDANHWLNSVFNNNNKSLLVNNREMYTSRVLATENLLHNYVFDNELDFNKNNINPYELYDKNYTYSPSNSNKNNNVRRSYYNYFNNSHHNEKKVAKANNTSGTNALATRRARNKLASAKYRAKKQALTHAMQDRIMQLTTQVMALNDQLSQAKKNETEILDRYKRLVEYFQLHGKGEGNKKHGDSLLF